nr:MAG TPA: resistance protein [Caudoviricetes sp.]
MVEAGEIPEEAIADTLESIEGDFKEKADNTACMIKNLLAEAEAIKKEQEALAARAKSKLTRADGMKAYLARAMQETGVMKLETPRNVLSFRRSASLFIQDEEDFKQKHADLCKREIKVTIPKSEITKLIKEGQMIDGVELRENMNLQVK